MPNFREVIMRAYFPIKLMAWTGIMWLVTGLFAADSPQFRGPQRNGIFPADNLLQSWPASGPSLLWSTEGLGQGFASVAVSGGMLYTTGMKDMQGSVMAFTRGGKLAWTYNYGDEHHGSGFPGARSTPTINDGRVYVITGRGVALCLDAQSGEKVWDYDLLANFAGNRQRDDLIPRWSVVESPLILGDKMIATPGGPETTMVALNKQTGELMWQTASTNSLSGYCAPRLYEHNGLRQIITMTGKAMIGVDPDTGKLLWSHNYPASYDIHANSPVFHQDLIYVSDGYGHGGKAFRIAADGSGVTQIWQEETLDIHHGGIISWQGRIYGAASNGDWKVLDFTTGKILAETEAVGKGSVVLADGRLIAYGEKGDLGLLNPDPAKFQLISQFEITRGTGQHWAHPVVSDGVLYIRHGDALMAFDIRAE